MTQEFDNWTVYDSWLVENYNDYDITKLEQSESTGKIIAEYEAKVTN